MKQRKIEFEAVVKRKDDTIQNLESNFFDEKSSEEVGLFKV